MRMVFITTLVSCMLLGCFPSNRRFSRTKLAEFDSVQGLNIIIRYDNYSNIKWKGLLDELSHVDLGFFNRVYIGDQFICLDDYPYGRPDNDFNENKVLKVFKLDAADKIECFDRWVSNLSLRGVDISIGGDVPLSRIISALVVLHSHRVRPHVLFFDPIDGDYILFREAFLGPRPQVWENAPPGWREYKIITTPRAKGSIHKITWLAD